MNVHVPQSDETIIELMELSTTKENIISAQGSKPNIAVVQDSLLGAFLMTKNNMKLTQEQFFDISMHGQRNEKSACLWSDKKANTIREVLKMKGKEVEVFNGRGLFSLLLPDDFGTYSLIWIIFISIGSFFSAWFSSPLLSIQPTLSKIESTRFVNDLTKQIIAILSLLLLFLLMGFLIFDNIFKIEVFILSTALIPYLLYEFLRRLAMVKDKVKILFSISLFLYCSLFFWSFYYSNGNFLSITKIIVISYGVSSLLLLASLRLNFISGNLSNLNSRRKEFSKWMTYSSLLQFICSNAVSIFSALILPLSEIGVLRLAQTFVGLFNPLLAYLDNHIRIYFSRILSAEGQEKLESSFRSFKIKFLFFYMMNLRVSN